MIQQASRSFRQPNLSWGSPALLLAGLILFSSHLAAGSPQILYFPLVADGEAGNIRFQTSFFVSNPGEDGLLRLDSFTREGNPMPLQVTGEATPFTWEVDLSRGRVFSGTSPGLGELAAGYVVARFQRSSPSGAGGPEAGGTAVFSRFEAGSGTLVSEAGVGTPPALSEFHLLLDSRQSRDTGLAMVNPWESAGIARIRISVWDPGFSELIATTEFQLGLGQGLSRFIWEFFITSHPPSVIDRLRETQGVVTLVSSQALAALTLRQTDSLEEDFPGEVPVLTIFPVLPGRADEMLFTPIGGSDVLAVETTSQHYQLRHASGDTVDSLRQDAYFDWLEQELGFAPEEKIRYFKYRDPEHMFRLTGFRMTGFAPGYSLNFHSVKTFDNHETVHVFTDSQLGLAIPFLIEGLAVAHEIDDPAFPEAGPRWGARSVHDVAREFVFDNKLPPLDMMLDAFGWLQLTGGGQSYPAYPLAGSFVRFEIDRFGSGSMVQFFRASNPLDPPSVTRSRFLEIFGVGLDAEWTAWQQFALEQ